MRALSNVSVALSAAGRKPGTDRLDEFRKLTDLAKTDDGALNRLVGEALKKAGLVDAYKAEDGIGAAQKRSTDIFCTSGDTSIRLEFMWRSQVGVAAIAQYVLEKLYQYGKAIGYLNGH